MKAITIHEPWASLIAIGGKHYETREWKTNYRGQIAIHASKREPHLMLRTLSTNVQNSIMNCFYEKFTINSRALERMHAGCVVATAELVDCYEIHIDHTGDAVLMKDGYPKIWLGKESNKFQFDFYDRGRYAWELTNVERLIIPIPAKGQQGLWNWEGVQS
ncbi:ASCH domain-containing protein [Paenibacillus sp. FSL E2-0190]|uniref:ASCH domain-containing protein n=1 Tax=Paenibacillus sp. FSL E2-0190 TaxID=2954504 RepID=UPI0030EB1FF3